MSGFYAKNASDFILSNDLLEGRSWQLWVDFDRRMLPLIEGSHRIDLPEILQRSETRPQKEDLLFGAEFDPQIGSTVLFSDTSFLLLSVPPTATNLNAPVQLRRQILQENNTNPKINKLNARQRIPYLNITQNDEIYEARIVKQGVLSALVSGRHLYRVVLPDGTSIVTTCQDIKESRTQDVSWTLVLLKYDGASLQ